MDGEQVLKLQLLKMLGGGRAHMRFQEAVDEFPQTHINTVFPNGTYSFWHVLEHIRLTQHDILEFITNPAYQSPNWPEDYWPKNGETASWKMWITTISEYKKDELSLEQLIQERGVLAPIFPSKKITLLQEILLVSDHTAYHLGEFAIMRQTLSVWGKSHM